MEALPSVPELLKRTLAGGAVGFTLRTADGHGLFYRRERRDRKEEAERGDTNCTNEHEGGGRVTAGRRGTGGGGWGDRNCPDTIGDSSQLDVFGVISKSNKSFMCYEMGSANKSYVH